MPLTVVVGGQFGSEGKGKVAHYSAKTKKATVAVRVGGSNSGHTVVDDLGRRLVFRVLPTAAILPDVTCVIGAGSYVDPALLAREIELAAISPERVIVDENAFVVSEEHRRSEQEAGLRERIGSTLSGTGASVIDRIRRVSSNQLARNDGRLAPFIGATRSFLRSRLNRRERVVLEGTQGFGLSLLHSPYYPNVTSRDTTAAAFVAEAGLSPLDVDEVVMVIRSFPIRVAGHSGTLPNETDWETVAFEGGWESPLTEYTSVTNKVRRVGRFDPQIVKLASEANLPTTIVLNHLDHVDAGCVAAGRLTLAAQRFLNSIEKQIQRQIDFVGIGDRTIIDIRRVTSDSRFA